MGGWGVHALGEEDSHGSDTESRLKEASSGGCQQPAPVQSGWRWMVCSPSHRDLRVAVWAVSQGVMNFQDWEVRPQKGRDPEALSLRLSLLLFLASSLSKMLPPPQPPDRKKSITLDQNENLRRHIPSASSVALPVYDH